jgi:hypothetical protein
VTGWIGVLFPYLVYRDDVMLNTDLHKWSKCFNVAKSYGVQKALNLAMEASKLGFCAHSKEWFNSGIALKAFPAGLSKAPVHVTWLDVGIQQDLFFCGGVFAVHQHPDGALEARTGWAVVDPSQAVVG